jgi:ribonuclease P protein component
LPPNRARRRASRYRLRGTGAFEAVFAAGRRLDGCYLQLVAAPAAQSIGRIGYVIGRKAMPRAVDRNRLRAACAKSCAQRVRRSTLTT